MMINSIYWTFAVSQHCTKCCGRIISFNLHCNSNSNSNRPYYYSCFTDEGTETQRDPENLNSAYLTPNPPSEHLNILFPYAVSLWENWGLPFTFYSLTIFCSHFVSGPKMCMLCVTYSRLWPLGGVSVLLEFSYVVLLQLKEIGSN